MSENQAVELGTIRFCNLDGEHGAVESALEQARSQGRPILAVFAEIPG